MMCWAGFRTRSSKRLAVSSAHERERKKIMSGWRSGCNLAINESSDMNLFV